ncbi:CAZyme family CE3 [Penicillium taxi]|uniref:CAZyme family CE3 n=1 Tax=Penicillium taxi TaxID=168475 RepID=UPI0025452119|nr:CAZyme family CE3 [Penicillium taxi]KAJ5895055.1 CAZyme family CE3 [Penicillium taxi]
MPLGASITNGWKSTDGNGYREWIRQQLRYSGWEVEMVGSLENGTMNDNYNEGHVGFRVDQLPKQAMKTISHKPNLILINCGANDALQNHKVSTTGQRMDSLLTLLFDSIPGTTIILSTLLPNKQQQSRTTSISKQYRDVVAYRRARKDRIVLADMSKFITHKDLNDSTHPTDEGYKKMASVWWAAIKEANRENMIQDFNYTITEFREKKLDDSTKDPDLPSYTAPAQPVLRIASLSSQSAPVELWVMAIPVLIVSITVMTILR